MVGGGFCYAVDGFLLFCAVAVFVVAVGVGVVGLVALSMGDAFGAFVLVVGCYAL